MIDENKAHREICIALNHNQELAYLCDFLDTIPASYPELTKKVNDLLKKAATTSPDDIFAAILKEYDHLRLSHQDGFVQAAQRSDVLLKVDSGADVVITSEAAAHPGSLVAKKQRWGWLNPRHSITTNKVGKIQGEVNSVPRRSMVVGKPSTRALTRRVNFSIPAAISEDSVTDIMGLEPLIKHPDWHSVILQLSDDPQKKSYMAVITLGYHWNGSRVRRAGTFECTTTHVSRQSATTSTVSFKSI